MAEETKKIEIPKEFILDGKQTIKKLDNLKIEILGKVESISKQNKELETKLKKIASFNKKIKINQEHKAALKEDFDRYLGALEQIVKEIEVQIINWNQFITPETSPVKIEKWEDLITFGIYLRQKVTTTKQFVKKVKKDVSVAHSRFCFRFDTQQKQLNYLEHMHQR